MCLGAVGKPTDDKHALVGSLVDNHMNTLDELSEYVSERENLALDAETRSFSLPPAKATDKLLRYEAQLDRQLYRAMDRLQRRRRGEAVPAPININVGGLAMSRCPSKQPQYTCMKNETVGLAPHNL